MSTRPRTIEHFPRMKVRGKRRRLQREVDSISAALGTMADMARAAGAVIGEAVGALVRFRGWLLQNLANAHQSRAKECMPSMPLACSWQLLRPLVRLPRRCRPG